MRSNDKRACIEALTALAAAFRAEGDEAFFAGYWMALDDLPLSAVQTAVRRAVRECKFMPSARELRDLTGEVGVSARAMIAWDAVNAAIGRIGGYRSVDFDDPVTTAVVRHLGGWQALCDKTADELDNFVRKDFERAYAGYWQTGVTSQQAAPLLGISAQLNALHGHDVNPPERVAVGLPDSSDRVRRVGSQQDLPRLPAVLDIGKLPDDIRNPRP